MLSTNLPVKRQVYSRSTKLYFTHYSRAIIIFCNTGLYKSALSTCFFWKLVFRLSVFYDFSVCSEFSIRSLFFVESITFYTIIVYISVI